VGCGAEACPGLTRGNGLDPSDVAERAQLIDRGRVLGLNAIEEDARMETTEVLFAGTDDERVAGAHAGAPEFETEAEANEASGVPGAQRRRGALNELTEAADRADQAGDLLCLRDLPQIPRGIRARRVGERRLGLSLSLRRQIDLDLGEAAGLDIHGVCAGSVPSELDFECPYPGRYVAQKETALPVGRHLIVRPLDSHSDTLKGGTALDVADHTGDSLGVSALRDHGKGGKQ